jgi:hypothetical protein
MSVLIECDYCQEAWYDGDGPYMYENETISGDNFNHVCNDCMNNTNFCEVCDERFDANDEGLYCDTIGYWVCDADIAFAHQDTVRWSGFCVECEYEEEGYDTRGPWAELLA